MIRAAAAALLLLCALVDPVAGMKLPLTKGRFGALKKLLVYVGSVDRTTNVEQWSELSGVPGLIDRASAAISVAPTACVASVTVRTLLLRNGRKLSRGRREPVASGMCGCGGPSAPPLPI